MARRTTDAEFLDAWARCGASPTKAARMLGISVRAALSRRDALEARYGKGLPTANQAVGAGRGDAGNDAAVNDYMQRVTLGNVSGTAIVFSDAHYWPGAASLAHRALIEVCRAVRPVLLIANGDIFDGARLSRFPRNGWEHQPKVIDEVDAVRERMAEVEQAAGRAQLIRTVGNHDIRLDRFLAMHASDFEGMQGFRLADHLPKWRECMSVMVNGHTMIKHRFRGGIHAAYSNTLHAGMSMVTGHTHYLEVRPWGDYRGRRYGVQTGALAEVDGPQFGYTEDNPTPWCSGFAVLTFAPDGELMPPELVEVTRGRALFRGEVVATMEAVMQKPVSRARRDAPSRVKRPRRKAPPKRKMMARRK